MSIYINSEGKKFRSITQLINFCKLDFRFKNTFSDEALTKLQCYAARRSFLDLFELVKTYFPDTTEAKLAYILFNKIKNFRCIYCYNINKVVFFFYGVSNRLNCGLLSCESHHIGKGVYSYNQLKEMAQKYRK